MQKIFRKSFCLAVLTLSLLLPRTGETTILRFLEMEELTEISDLIVLGKVLEVESGWDQAHSRIRTRVVLEVQRVLLGSLENETLTIELPGGLVPEEDLRQVVPGVPIFTVGEETVVFLRRDLSLFCPVAGWIQGKFEIITDSATGRKEVLDRFGKFRRYIERKAGITKPKTLAGLEKVSVEEFAAVIATIQAEKGSRQ